MIIVRYILKRSEYSPYYIVKDTVNKMEYRDVTDIIDLLNQLDAEKLHLKAELAYYKCVEMRFFE